MRVKLVSLILRVEHTLRVLENRVLRKIFGPKRDEVTGEWRKLYNEDLHNLWVRFEILMAIIIVLFYFFWKKPSSGSH
jgi:hypothetical protein